MESGEPISQDSDPLPLALCRLEGMGIEAAVLLTVLRTTYFCFSRLVESGHTPSKARPPELQWGLVYDSLLGLSWCLPGKLTLERVEPWWTNLRRQQWTSLFPTPAAPVRWYCLGVDRAST